MERAKKIFGWGPWCFIIGLLFVSAVYKLELFFGVSQMSITDATANLLFWIFIGLTFIFVAWGFISLPVERRGEALVTKGAFKYVRHPLYASFIDFFVIGVGFYLKSYAVVLSVIPLLFICGWIVSKEEVYLEELFGKKYASYKAKTKRFIPGIY